MHKDKLMRQHRKKHHSWEQKLNEKGLQPALLMWKTILLKQATNEEVILIVVGRISRPVAVAEKYLEMKK